MGHDFRTIFQRVDESSAFPSLPLGLTAMTTWECRGHRPVSGSNGKSCSSFPPAMSPMTAKQPSVSFSDEETRTSTAVRDRDDLPLLLALGRDGGLKLRCVLAVHSSPEDAVDEVVLLVVTELGLSLTTVLDRIDRRRKLLLRRRRPDLLVCSVVTVPSADGECPRKLRLLDRDLCKPRDRDLLTLPVPEAI